MHGFKNTHLNDISKQYVFDTIVNALIKSCLKMINDCLCYGEFLPNHEEKIRNYLLENYLDNDTFKNTICNIPLRFMPEVPESYNYSSYTYDGRIDIKVISENYFIDRSDYYIVECKRIDGTSTLYKKYINEGVSRFVADKPKYHTRNNKNIMLGFIVKDLDLAVVIASICKIHDSSFTDRITKKLSSIFCSSNYNICESTYTNKLMLKHIFFNISNVIM
jgi:hypothetical protein